MGPSRASAGWLLFLVALGCGGGGQPTNGADAAAGNDVALAVDAHPDRAMLVIHDPIYYTDDRQTYRISGSDRTSVRFGAPGPALGLGPSPSGQRVVQILRDGTVHVYSSTGTELGAFASMAAFLIGWIDEDTLLLHRIGDPSTLIRTRIDGADSRVLPAPSADPRVGVSSVALAPDGSHAAVQLFRLDQTSVPPAIHIISTSDGAETSQIDAHPTLGPIWARDGALVWIEDGKLARATDDLHGKTLATLPFAPCSLDYWGRGSVLVGSVVLVSPDVGYCDEFRSIGTDGQGITPLPWLTTPEHGVGLGQLMVRVSPDGTRLVVHDLLGPGLWTADLDGSLPEFLTAPIEPVTALAW